MVVFMQDDDDDEGASSSTSSSKRDRSPNYPSLTFTEALAKVVDGSLIPSRSGG